MKFIDYIVKGIGHLFKFVFFCLKIGVIAALVLLVLCIIFPDHLAQVIEIVRGLGG